MPCRRSRAGASAHVVTGDLSDTGAVPALAAQVRAAIGELDAICYAPTPESRDWGPTVSPARLADLLWNMNHAKGEREANYPA